MLLGLSRRGGVECELELGKGNGWVTFGRDLAKALELLIEAREQGCGPKPERPGLTRTGTVTDPVPMTGLARNFTPIPRIAPPPLGSEMLGAAKPALAASPPSGAEEAGACSAPVVTGVASIADGSGSLLT